MKHTNLYNNVRMPLLGIGTFMISPEDTEKSVYEALKLGYRLIDTANAYLNEKEVGNALRKAISEGIVTREEVFVSTKLWATLYENENSVDDTLNRLGLDYVDLLFIHQPSGNFMAGYKQLEKAYKEGKARSLGISNFYGDKLETLLAKSEIKPHVVQLEAHPYCTEGDVMNADIFDFTLTEEEMAEIAKLDGTKKYYNSDNETEEKYATMHLPFETDVN